MKNLKKILAVTLIVSSLLSAAVFADTTDVSIQDRIEQLKKEGLDREEIKAILLEEGFELEKSEGRNHKGAKLDLKGKSGRSGLGLTIVNNILKLYHFDLELKNCEMGVEYIISKIK